MLCGLARDRRVGDALACHSGVGLAVCQVAAHLDVDVYALLLVFCALISLFAIVMRIESKEGIRMRRRFAFARSPSSGLSTQVSLRHFFKTTSSRTSRLHSLCQPPSRSTPIQDPEHYGASCSHHAGHGLSCRRDQGIRVLGGLARQQQARDHDAHRRESRHHQQQVAADESVQDRGALRQDGALGQGARQ